MNHFVFMIGIFLADGLRYVVVFVVDFTVVEALIEKKVFIKY